MPEVGGREDGGPLLPEWHICSKREELAGIVVPGLLALLLLVWNLCPVSKLGSTTPATHVIELLTYFGDRVGEGSSVPLPCTYLDATSSATQSWHWWEMQLVQSWEPGGKGAPSSWLHLSRVEAPPHWAGGWETVGGSNATDSLFLWRFSRRSSWNNVSLLLCVLGKNSRNFKWLVF